MNSLVGGVADPLRLGTSAGTVSGSLNATAGQIAIATVQEASRALALVPVGAAIGKGTGTLANSLVGGIERQAAGKLAGTLAAEGTAMRNVAQFQGMEVRAVRDLSHLDQGTLEAMQEVGFAPRTVNGEQIPLHHLNQNPAGPLVEMPRGNNLVGNTVQHPLGNTAGAGLTDAQRAAFNTWRTDYWKWRATQELNLRRVLGN